MTWRVTVVVSDANGTPVDGAELTRTVWTGGQLDRQGPTKIASQFTFDADDAARNIACELNHPRYAPLVISMVRELSDQSWKWTHPTRQVFSSGQDVLVGAVLGRIKWPPTSYVPEDQLASRAEKAKGLIDRRSKQPTTFSPLDEFYRSLLTTKDAAFYRLQASVQKPIPNFHVVAPDLVGPDPSKTGWDRFGFQVAAVDPAKSGRLHLVEYGEVASNAAPGPRFLVGVWVPNNLSRLGVDSLDFIVWLHPSTTSNPLNYPQDSYPFRNKYPYALWAERRSDGTYGAPQRYVDLPIHHLYEQHYLLYQAEASRRNVVIVLPVGPSGEFGPFVFQSTLFRFLKELCLWIPRGDGRGLPAKFPSPPRVGKVAVSAFSLSGPLLQTLIDNRQGNLQYAAAEWTAMASGSSPRLGVVADNRAFDETWREIWSIDDVAAGFPSFVDRAIQWFGGSNERALRIYKSVWTGGWQLEQPASPQLRQFVARGRMLKKEAGTAKAVIVQDPGGRWTLTSMSNEFVSGPTKDGPPPPSLQPNSPHEMMPRLMFGHAAGMSGLTRSAGR